MSVNGEEVPLIPEEKIPSTTDAFGKIGLLFAFISLVSTTCVDALRPLVSPVAAFAFISATTYGVAARFVVLFICIAFSDKAFDVSEETFNTILDWISSSPASEISPDKIFKISNYKNRLWNSNIAEFLFSTLAFSVVMMEFVDISNYTTIHFIYCIYLLHFSAHIFYTFVNLVALFFTVLYSDDSYLCFLFLSRMKPDNQGRCVLIVSDDNGNLKKIVSEEVDVGFREALLYTLILPFISLIIIIFFLMVILSCHVSGYMLWNPGQNCTESLVYF